MMSMMFRVLERAVAKLAPGRAPFFIEAHLVKALMTLDSEGPVGRVTLSKTIGLGEGTVRTMVKHLENEGLVKTSKVGIILTAPGKKFASGLRAKMIKDAEMPRSSLTIGPFNVAILVKNAAKAVKSGVEQRDAAIKVGALGATTLICHRGRLNMPLVKEDAFRDAPAAHANLISVLKPQENDVIIIGSADDKLTAELGAITAALQTLKVH